MDSDTNASTAALLGSDEPPPVELVNADGRSSAVLVCDHASNRVPRQLDGKRHIGISHWRDRRLAALLLGVLARSGEFTVGDNAPYPIDEDVDYTIPVHGEGRGLPSVMIEIRQDGIQTAAGAAAWAARLPESYRLIEAEALSFFGSSFGGYSASHKS
jgi:predicted N-formylglutamate amidohydrolase